MWALHPAKTRMVDVRTAGFDCLGYHFVAGRSVPRARSLTRLKHTVRAKTRRTRGDSLAMVITDLNRTLRGWFEYFKHSHRCGLARIDGWIRRRLRRLLRKQQGRRGIARTCGADQSRWQNAFFESRGLFSLPAAHAIARRSPSPRR